MSQEPYKPVSCSLYDVLEAAAMRRSPVVLVLDSGSTDVLVKDVFSKGSEEFIVVLHRDSGNAETIRLDRIRQIIDPVQKTVYSPNSC